jgi:hypothetical protein
VCVCVQSYTSLPYAHEHVVIVCVCAYVITPGDILRAIPDVLPPTVIVRAGCDVKQLSAHIYTHVAIFVDGSDTKKQFVTKENFSAGKEVCM